MHRDRGQKPQTAPFQGPEPERTLTVLPLGLKQLQPPRPDLPRKPSRGAEQRAQETPGGERGCGLQALRSKHRHHLHFYFCTRTGEDTSISGVGATSGRSGQLLQDRISDTHSRPGRQPQADLLTLQVNAKRGQSRRPETRGSQTLLPPPLHQAATLFQEASRRGVAGPGLPHSVGRHPRTAVAQSRTRSPDGGAEGTPGQRECQQMGAQVTHNKEATPGGGEG